MSDDEDEELAMLRLQALMSKRRAGTKKDAVGIPFSVSMPSMPIERVTQVTAETAVVTSTPIGVNHPPAMKVISEDANAYRPPHFPIAQVSCHNCN